LEEFVSSDQRLAYYNEVLKINQILAHTIYLDVVPLSVDENGVLEEQRSREFLCYAIKTRRLDSENTLMEYLNNNWYIDTKFVEMLAQKIALFHQSGDTVINTFKVGSLKRHNQETARIKYFVEDLIGKEHISTILS